jgi:primosomal replication protein N''
VQELKEILARKRGLEAPVIRDRWLARQLPFRNEAWNRMFQERDSSRGSSKSLREAVNLSWDKGLAALRPCWLVSPGAASQIFPREPGLFDLVIFDEASQCPVEQAIPAIYRGKNLIVAGDEKQLPPTSFFSAGLDNDEEEREEDELEADTSPAEAQRRRERREEEQSLLECSNLLELAIGKLKQLYLSVHYRSDHPALIEFSNRAFYAGQLEAPPARKISIAGERPIEYHAVNGQYSDRTNAEEARYIVALLKKRWLLPSPNPTIGIVTFNQAQRDLIDNLIEAETGKDEQFAARYKQERDRREKDQDVGFFVKNLENVQGDERDVMIFSTTFGKDRQDRFFRRFGPVAAAGGHRRLNVAITRAKKQIVIVGSMPIEQIAALDMPAQERTAASFLQLYLLYAKAVSAGDEEGSRLLLSKLGGLADGQRQEVIRETPLEGEIRKVLTEWGYRVERGVGGSGFSLDLGVLHTDPREGYVLGIECDGGAHFTGRAARIREVWRKGLLEARGWKIHRIWSDSWWLNPEAERRRLRMALEAAQQSATSYGLRGD